MPPNSQLLSLLGKSFYAGEFWLVLIERIISTSKGLCAFRFVGINRRYFPFVASFFYVSFSFSVNLRRNP